MATGTLSGGRSLAEMRAQLAEFDERTYLLLALRRVESEAARLRALLGELGTGA